MGIFVPQLPNCILRRFAFGCKLERKIPFPVIPQAVCAFVKAQQEFLRDGIVAGYTRSLGWECAREAFLCKTQSSSHSYLQSDSVAILGIIGNNTGDKEWGREEHSARLPSCSFLWRPAGPRGPRAAHRKNSRNASTELKHLNGVTVENFKVLRKYSHANLVWNTSTI